MNKIEQFKAMQLEALAKFEAGAKEHNNSLEEIDVDTEIYEELVDLGNYYLLLAIKMKKKIDSKLD